ncbi:uncharacterized protein LOC130371532 [Gadus chalcogrammus]|uniref:uncharacterized protein LOC130371532 n=1 Tax=Gadus chalcogrammus TaxID=1042646 RepID=UPI0024C3BA4E|nr:uncharacterized protein LOC130371532 [Gadus chalcogrammus]
MNGLFYMISILSISLAPPVSGNICLGTPVECKNISTGDGYYKYPWSLPPGKVCKDLEVYADNHMILMAKHPNATLPKLTQCRNLTVRCIYEMNGTADVDEICRKFVTDSDASSLSDPGRPKQQLNNTSEPTDMDSVKNKPSPTDQRSQPAAFWITVVGPVAVVVAVVLAVAGAAWWCLRKKKPMPTQNQGLELTEMNRPDDGDQTPSGHGETTEDGALPEKSAENLKNNHC